MHSTVALAATSLAHDEHRRRRLALGQAAHASGAAGPLRSRAYPARRGDPRHNRHARARRRPGRSSSASTRVSIVAPGWRGAQIARLGEGPWKGLYSIAAGVGLGAARSSATAWRGASRSCSTRRRPALRHLALLLMLPVFPLLFAAYLPGRIRAAREAPDAARDQALGAGAPARQRHAGRRAAVRRLPRLGGGRPDLGQAARRPTRTPCPARRRGRSTT